MNNNKRGSFQENLIKVYDSIKDSVSFGVHKILRDNNPISNFIFKVTRNYFWTNLFKKSQNRANAITEKVKKSDQFKKAKNIQLTPGIKQKLKTSKVKWDNIQEKTKNSFKRNSGNKFNSLKNRFFAWNKDASKKYI